MSDLNISLSSQTTNVVESGVHLTIDAETQSLSFNNPAQSLTLSLQEPRFGFFYLGGPAGPAGPAFSLNGLQSSVNLLGLGNITIGTVAPSTIYIGSTGLATSIELSGVSGMLSADTQATGSLLFSLYSNLSGTTYALSGYVTGEIFALSGYINEQNLVLSAKIEQTGQDLYSYVTGLSGQVRLDYSNLSNRIYQTGSDLYQLITGVSGYATSSAALSGYLTGQVAALSGYVNQVSGALDQSIQLTGQSSILYTNWIGSLLSGDINSLSGFSVFVSGVLQNQINQLTTTGQLLSTGQQLYILITGLSGQSALDYATKSQLYQTGDALNSKILSLSGYIDQQDYLTGQALIEYSNNISQAISGSLYQTGSNLYNQLYITGQTLGNRDVAISGGIEVRIAATGGAAIAYVNSVGSNLSGNLTNTGVLLINLITSVSGALENQLAETGNAAIIHANGIGINLSGALEQTGILLINQINALSGFTTGVSGILQDAITSGDTSISGYVYTISGVLQEHIDHLLLYSNPLFFRGSIQSELPGYALMTYNYPTGFTPTTGYYQNVQNGQLLTGFLSQSGQPGLEGFIQGQNIASINASVRNINEKNTSLYYQLLKYTAAGAFQLVTTSHAGPILTDKEEHYDFSAFITGLNLVPTDRLAIRWYAQTQGGGTDPDIYLTWGDDTQAAESLPVSASVLASTYYPNTNPSGFITTGQTGQFYPASNPRGYATSGNLTSTGSNLFGFITGLSGQFTGDYATKVQLTQTGSTLNSRINSLSGFTVGISDVLSGQIAQTGATTIFHANSIGQIISGNLTITGQTLQSRMMFVSGLAISISGTLSDKIYLSGQALVNYSNGIGINISGNMAETGSLLLQNNLNTSGVLTGRIYETGIGLYNQLYNTGQFIISVSGGLEARIRSSGEASVNYSNGIGINLSGNLFNTGLNLFRLITGLSGQSVSDYATKTELFSTGTELFSKINSLSGFVNGVSGILQSEIDNTGTLAIAYANGVGANLSGNLTQTGILLGSQTAFLSGFTTGSLYNTSNLIALTGQAALSYSNNIGVNLSGNLTQTGIALINRDSSISGTLQSYINDINGGTGKILENVVFTSGLQYISGSKYFLGDTYINNLFVTGTQTVVNLEDIYVANNWLVLNSTGEARDSAIWISTGITGASATGGILGFDVPSNRWVFGIGGFQTELNGLPLIASVEEIDIARINLESLLYQTGAALINYSNGIGANVSGNLTQTGIALSNLNLNTSGVLSSRLAQTGTDLYIQLYNTGQSLISVSGALEVRIFATGNAAIVHANSIGQSISGQLTLSGQTLTNKLTALSGYVNNQDYATGLAAISYASVISGVLNSQIVLSGLLLNANNVANATNLSGNLAQTGVILWNRDALISGGLESRIAATGAASILYANTVGVNLSGNLAQTGATLRATIFGGDANLSGALTQTGIILNNRIAALSGYVTGLNGQSVSFSSNLIPTGYDTYYINFPVVFSSTPRIVATIELQDPAGSLYGMAISGCSNTGFFAMLTDTIDNTSVFLNIIAKV